MHRFQPSFSPLALGQFGGTALDVIKATAHEECLFWNVVVVAVGQRFECRDGFSNRYEGSVEAGEGLGNEGVLRQEALDTTGTANEDAILFGEFVDTKDRDDVLQVLVSLQDLLGAVGNTEVVLADLARIKDARS